MSPRAAVDGLEPLAGPAFEERFLPIMIDHHKGAIRMVDELRHHFADPRVLLMADLIRHAQRSRIRRMQALHESKAGRMR